MSGGRATGVRFQVGQAGLADDVPVASVRPVDEAVVLHGPVEGGDTVGADADQALPIDWRFVQGEVAFPIRGEENGPVVDEPRKVIAGLVMAQEGRARSRLTSAGAASPPSAGSAGASAEMR